MIRIAGWIAIAYLLVAMGIGSPASAQPAASPDRIRLTVQKVEISTDDINYITIFDSPVGVDLDKMGRPELGKNEQVQVGTYKVLRLTVTEISWHAAWGPSNPSPCDGATSGEANGSVALDGNTLLYFKAPELGGNTLAYYQAHPPLSGYVGDAKHPFILSSPVKVLKDTVTAVNLVFGVTNTLTCDTIGIYSRTGAGDVVPLRTIGGPNTGLKGLEGLYVDTENWEMGVANSDSDSITTYSSGASGDVAPLRTIIGQDTLLNDPAGVALYLDPGGDRTKDEIIVANAGNHSVTTYNRRASGNAKPVRTISGIFTGLGSPVGVAIYLDPGGEDSKDEIIVANSGNDSVTVYSRMALKNTSPLRALSRLIITTANNVINLTEAGGKGTVNAMIGAGIYESKAALAAAIGEALGGAITVGTTFTVMYDDSTGLFTITVTALGTDVTSVTLNWDATETTSGEVLGFDPVGSGALVTGSSDTSDFWDRTGLNEPCGIYVDTINGEMVVANRGNDSITIYSRTASGDVAPIRTITGSSTGLKGPRGLDLDRVTNEIWVAHRGQQAVMAFLPPIFSVSSNGDAPSSVLTGDYNVVFYGMDIKGVNGQGLLIPVVFAERGTATFDPTTPWPSFTFSLDTQVKRQVLEPDCPTPDIGVTKSGIYGVNREGDFYAFLPDTGGSLQGAFLSDGSVFVGSLYDSPTKLLLVYGVKAPGPFARYLTADGTSTGSPAYYGFTTYRNDLFNINRPNDNDIFRYILGIGMAKTDNISFSGVSMDANFVSVLNPMGEFRDPGSGGPQYREGFLNNPSQPYTSLPGGLLENPSDGLAGALTGNGGILIFIRDYVTKDGYGCPNDIGFGVSLRQSLAGTFNLNDLQGTYFIAAFGDRFDSYTKTASHISTAASITFDGSGGAEMTWLENKGGIISVERTSFTYQINTRPVPEIGYTRQFVDVVDIFDRTTSGPYASALMGEDGQSLIFFRNLYPGREANPTRLLGLALFQHP